MGIRVGGIAVTFVLLGGFLPAGLVQAHDVWMIPETGPAGLQVVIHHGHPGDRKTPDPDKLFELRAIGPDGQDRLPPGVFAPAMREGNPVLLAPPLPVTSPSGTWLFVARYDNGYWVKTPQGHRNTSKRQSPDAADSLYSMKYAKALVATGSAMSDVYRRVLGHRLELVPMEDPFSVPVGGKLPVLVLFEGKPLVGIGIEIGDGVTPRKEEEIPRYLTNSDGVAQVPITRAGLQLVVVDYTTASRHLDLADKDLMAATLSFVLENR